MTKNRQRIGAGIARVDDHRFAQFTADLDMMNERRLLAHFCFGGIKVVQSRLTHRHHVVISRQMTQFFHVIRFVLIEWMYAARENDVIALADQFPHSAVPWQRCRHRQTEFHIARSGFRQHVIHILMQRLIIQAIEMAVRVD